LDLQTPRAYASYGFSVSPGLTLANINVTVIEARHHSNRPHHTEGRLTSAKAKQIPEILWTKCTGKIMNSQIFICR
jgi:hypothetical protein